MLMTAKEARKKALGIDHIVDIVLEDLIAPVIEEKVQEGGECLCFVEVGQFFESRGCEKPGEELMTYLVDELRTYGYVVSCDWFNCRLIIVW